MVMVEVEGRHMGRNDRLFGEIGTIIMPLTPFSRIGPPADKEQAVDPVGVDISIPSPEVRVKSQSSTLISRVILSWLLLDMQTSLIQTFIVFVCSSSLVLTLTTSRRMSLLSSKGGSICFLCHRTILVSTSSISTRLNRHMKPRVPLWKVTTGGILLLNSLAAYKIVPSPPIVMMQSTKLWCLAGMNSTVDMSEWDFDIFC